MGLLSKSEAARRITAASGFAVSPSLLEFWIDAERGVVALRDPRVVDDGELEQLTELARRRKAGESMQEIRVAVERSRAFLEGAGTVLTMQDEDQKIFDESERRAKAQGLGDEAAWSIGAAAVVRHATERAFGRATATAGGAQMYEGSWMIVVKPPATKTMAESVADLERRGFEVIRSAETVGRGNVLEPGSPRVVPTRREDDFARRIRRLEATLDQGTSDSSVFAETIRTASERGVDVRLLLAADPSLRQRIRAVEPPTRYELAEDRVAVLKLRILAERPETTDMDLWSLIEKSEPEVYSQWRRSVVAGTPEYRNAERVRAERAKVDAARAERLLAAAEESSGRPAILREIGRCAAELMAKDQKLTKSEAQIKVLSENAELSARYRAAFTAGSREGQQ